MYAALFIAIFMQFQLARVERLARFESAIWFGRSINLGKCVAASLADGWPMVSLSQPHGHCWTAAGVLNGRCSTRINSLNNRLIWLMDGR